MMITNVARRAWLAGALLLCACANPETSSSPDAGDAGADGTASDAGPAPAADTGAEASAHDAAPPPVDSSIALPSGTPPTVLLDGARLAALQKELSEGGSAAQKAAFQNLIAAADSALGAGVWSVTDKAADFVANGDPHEYASWGPYWWPSDANPPSVAGTVSKCPYVNHDGIRNPNVDKITDRHGLHASSEAILELALAWYFTGNTAYADQAERVARAWYLDPATAMKPDMAYAQQHGPCGVGNAAGLIEASGGYMTDALDGLAILSLDARANGWSPDDQAGLKTWMTKFLDWLKASSAT